MTEASEGVQRQQSDAKSCEGKECYFSIDQTLTYSYTYKRLEEGEDCHEPTDDQMASAVHYSQGRFEDFAKTYCKAGGFGDDQCEKPCKCLPTITQWKCKITGWRRTGNRCRIDTEISGHIDCTCQMD